MVGADNPHPVPLCETDRPAPRCLRPYESPESPRPPPETLDAPLAMPSVGQCRLHDPGVCRPKVFDRHESRARRLEPSAKPLCWPDKRLFKDEHSTALCAASVPSTHGLPCGSNAQVSMLRANAPAYHPTLRAFKASTDESISPKLRGLTPRDAYLHEATPVKRLLEHLASTKQFSIGGLRRVIHGFWKQKEGQNCQTHRYGSQVRVRCQPLHPRCTSSCFFSPT